MMLAWAWLLKLVVYDESAASLRPNQCVLWDASHRSLTKPSG